MKSIRFNFSHPVKGLARLLQICPKKQKCLTLIVESKEENLVEIPVIGCQQGKWRVEMEWEYDNRCFSHHEEFEIV